MFWALELVPKPDSFGRRRSLPISASVCANVTQGWDDKAPKGSGRRCACGTNTPSPRNPSGVVTAEEIAEAAIFWILKLLGKRFAGKYAPKDIASVLALPSRKEAFGIVAVETFVAGLAAVLFTARGSIGSLPDPEWVIMVQAGNVSKLADGLRRALSLGVQ